MTGTGAASTQGRRAELRTPTSRRYRARPAGTPAYSRDVGRWRALRLPPLQGPAGEVTGLDVFRTVLENTGAIITDRGFDPKNEKEFEKAIIQILRYAFKNVASRPSIPRALKNYKP